MMVDLVAAGLDQLHERISGRFARADPGRSVRVPDQLRRWTRGRG